MIKKIISLILIAFLVSVSYSTIPTANNKISINDRINNIDFEINPILESSILNSKKHTPLFSDISKPPIDNPNIEWETYFEGSTSWDVHQTSDNGYILAGTRDGDFLLLKTDENGVEEWNKTFGGQESENAWSCIQSNDNGYVIVGEKDNPIWNDIWVIKTDGNGVEEWDIILGTEQYGDNVLRVIQTSDNNFVLCGRKGAPTGGDDVWIIKIDTQGNEIWNKTFNGPLQAFSYDIGLDIIETTLGDLVAVGTTGIWGEPTRYGWIVKLSDNGNEIWNKTFGLDGKQSLLHSLSESTEGGFILSGHSGWGYPNQFDAWLIKVDSSGNEIWDKTYGSPGGTNGNKNEKFRSAIMTDDGGYLCAGYQNTYGPGSRGGWLVKTDNNGNEIWNETFGGDGDDRFLALEKTNDHNYILTGRFETESVNIWLLKISENQNQPPIVEIQNPVENQTLMGSFIIEGIAINNNQKEKNHCNSFSQKFEEIKKDGWKYFSIFDLTTPTPIEDYQVKVRINNESVSYDSINSNCSDIRFYDLEGNECSYWIEDWDMKSESIIWVKIPTQKSNKIIMVYGNKNASPMSSGKDTFLFFDDFSGESVNWSNWQSDYPDSFQVDNGWVTCTGRGGYPSLKTIQSFDKTSFIIEQKIEIVQLGNIYSSGYSNNLQNSGLRDGVYWYAESESYDRYVKFNAPEEGGTGAWYPGIEKGMTTGQVDMTVIRENGSLTWIVSGVRNFQEQWFGNTGNTPKRLEIFCTHNGYIVKCDWVRLREYANVGDPVVSISNPFEGYTVSQMIEILGESSCSETLSIDLVEIKIDSDGEWEDATGTTSWSYEWDTTSVANGLHTIYARAQDSQGQYSNIDMVNVTVTNEGNQPPERPQQPSGPQNLVTEETGTYYAYTSDPEENQICYRFDWGDNTYSDWSDFVTSQTPIEMSYSWNEAGTYKIRVQAQDIHGAKSTWSESLTVEVSFDGNYPPVADAGGPYDAEVGEKIRFDASESYDPDGSIVWYKWDFEDDGVYTHGSKKPYTYHTYLEEYEGVVKVKVFDDERKTDTDAASVVTFNPNINHAPQIQSLEFQETIRQGYQFSGEIIVYDPDYDRISIWTDWDNTGTFRKEVWTIDSLYPWGIAHTYSEPGTHIFNIKLEDIHGLFSEPQQFTVYVEVNNPPLIPSRPQIQNQETGAASITINEGTNICFISHSDDAEGDHSLDFAWDWGEGDEYEWKWGRRNNDEIVCQASHIWDIPTGSGQQTFQIRVKSKDHGGAESEWSDILHVVVNEVTDDYPDIVEISVSPNPAGAGSPNIIGSSDIVTFTADVSYDIGEIESYIWRCGDEILCSRPFTHSPLSYSTALPDNRLPPTSFDNPHTITLEVVADNGNTATATIDLTIIHGIVFRPSDYEASIEGKTGLLHIDPQERYYECDLHKGLSGVYLWSTNAGWTVFAGPQIVFDVEKEIAVNTKTEIETIYQLSSAGSPIYNFADVQIPILYSSAEKQSPSYYSQGWRGHVHFDEVDFASLQTPSTWYNPANWAFFLLDFFSFIPKFPFSNYLTLLNCFFELFQGYNGIEYEDIQQAFEEGDIEFTSSEMNNLPASPNEDYTHKNEFTILSEADVYGTAKAAMLTHIPYVAIEEAEGGPDGRLTFINQCPTDLMIIDPKGRILSKDVSSIPLATYIEETSIDGEKQDKITIPYCEAGEYQMFVISEIDADPDANYTILTKFGSKTEVLAENVSVSDLESMEHSYTVHQPTEPVPILGETSGVTLMNYSFTTSASHPLGEDIWYLWDWGGGNTSWMGPFESGENCTVNHSWTKSGRYSVKVKARHGVDSNWTEPISVDVYNSEKPRVTFLFGTLVNHSVYNSSIHVAEGKNLFSLGFKPISFGIVDTGQKIVFKKRLLGFGFNNLVVGLFNVFQEL